MKRRHLRFDPSSAEDHDSQGNSDPQDWSALFVFSAIMLVALLWVVPAIIRKCRNCCRNCRNRNRTRRPRTRIDARQQAFELALERMLYATEVEFVRTLLRPGGHPREQTERRKEYLENVLMKKKFSEYQSERGVQVDDDDATSSREIFSETASTTDLEAGDSSRIESHGDEDEIGDIDELEDEDSRDICAICLAKYDHDDVISWSNNKQCSHVFHRECIAQWLEKKEECPVCRRFFLHFDEESGTPGEGHVAPFGSSDPSSVLESIREMGRVYRMMYQSARDNASNGADGESSAGQPPRLDVSDESIRAMEAFTARVLPGRHQRIRIPREGQRRIPSSGRTRRGRARIVEEETRNETDEERPTITFRFPPTPGPREQNNTSS